jgi:hypothetical protein
VCWARQSKINVFHAFLVWQGMKRWPHRPQREKEEGRLFAASLRFGWRGHSLFHWDYWRDRSSWSTTHEMLLPLHSGFLRFVMRTCRLRDLEFRGISLSLFFCSESVGGSVRESQEPDSFQKKQELSFGSTSGITRRWFPSFLSLLMTCVTHG